MATLMLIFYQFESLMQWLCCSHLNYLPKSIPMKYTYSCYVRGMLVSRLSLRAYTWEQFHVCCEYVYCPYYPITWTDTWSICANRLPASIVSYYNFVCCRRNYTVVVVVNYITKYFFNLTNRYYLCKYRLHLDNMYNKFTREF